MVAGLARIALRSTPLRVATTSSSNKMMIARSLHSSNIIRAEVVDKDPQLGDYPQFEPRSTQSRRDDPRYWDRQEKRNFGETVSGGSEERRGCSFFYTNLQTNLISFISLSLTPLLAPRAR